ncbi:MAG: DNA-directed RNA polymerase subunit beta' [Chloroflexi bacterium]|nr:DNA-directed RNA polymerase subunit beta' [Chloroflexota bacterium]
MLEANDFDAVRISLASPEQIRSWSYGEVTKPETINYRTLKPEKDGLFCERIFGPTRDFECYCGKYKRVRYKGIICDKCGVEVAHSKVRRERMGHIELAAPVAHVWFAKGTPSRLGLLLDLSPRGLESVLYFAQYLVTSVDEAGRRELLDRMGAEADEDLKKLDQALEEQIKGIEAEAGTQGEQAAIEKINEMRRKHEEERDRLAEEKEALKEGIDSLQPLKIISETRYRELHDKYPTLFQASMGAEAVLVALQRIDLDKERERLLEAVHSSSGQRRKKASKRLRVIEAFRRSGNKPEWMILTVLPVLPPELRPMVQLDGGRFATSDLNDLYRRVINRNNRLRRLIELGAPEVMVRNEKRMLQEAVDSLVDNGRRSRAVSLGGAHALMSLSDMLRGKQGRFRQNLLGKRVDYSGRSVIVVGPELELHQCGLPRRMALELFKPFVMRRLVELGFAHNIKSARRQVERARPEVWDALSEVVHERPVLLNRAPTLHRLGIQAFEPVLIDGHAIQVHPLVCSAFNADFDGDQMAVHVPLSKAAVREARQQMLSIHNMLLPSSGEPVVSPTLDMVLGCFYMTSARKGGVGEGKRFGNFEEVKLAYDLGVVELGAEILAKSPRTGDVLKTTVGRILFNEVLPPELGFYNVEVDKATLKRIVSECHKILGNEGTAEVLDNLKRLGFHFATKSGTTISMSDMEVPAEKAKLLQKAEEERKVIEKQYLRGLITEDERYDKVVQVWTETTNKVKELISTKLDRYGGVYMMATSGAKGNISQITQMAGMRGLMTDPSGRIMEFPIRSSFREGLSVLEYFMSTHGARKGLADTALRTSDSGYLTRRLVDVAQDAIISVEDCGSKDGIWMSEATGKTLLPPLAERVLGRIATSDVANPQTGEVIVPRGQEINENAVKAIMAAGITRVHVRSALSCRARKGICRLCYGRDLARRHLVDTGMAVGIVAAESIGEPGTQLTMRTFHTGGVVGLDITSGLPRVEELFEARSPKGQAIISEIDGRAEIADVDGVRRIKVISSELYHDEYALPEGYRPLVSSGQEITPGTVLAAAPSPEQSGTEAVQLPTQTAVARIGGKAEVEDSRIRIWYEEKDEREYIVPPAARIRVEHGASIKAGDQLTDGPMNPQDILRIIGREAVQQYLVEEVQKVYRSQGVNINDKHIEVIVRQMLTKVRVESSGDTEFLPGELVDRFAYEEANAKVLAEGGEPATAQTVLLGITRASLNTDSWLAAASFQETTRVLTEAAVNGKVDRLSGLKENVIIGKLIPARCYVPEPQLEEAKQAPVMIPAWVTGSEEGEPHQDMATELAEPIAEEPFAEEPETDTADLEELEDEEEEEEDEKEKENE